MDLYPCPLGKDACPGGNKTGDELCGEGYEKALCSVCSLNYFEDSSNGGACTACEGSRGSWMTIAFGASVLVVGGGTATAWFLRPPFLFDPETGYIEKVAKTNILRFAIVTSQIISSLGGLEW